MHISTWSECSLHDLLWNERHMEQWRLQQQVMVSPGGATQ